MVERGGWGDAESSVAEFISFSAIGMALHLLNLQRATIRRVITDHSLTLILHHSRL